MSDNERRCEQCGSLHSRPSTRGQERWSVQKYCSLQCYGAAKTSASISNFMNQITFEPNTGCWLWLGSLRSGYGRVSVQRRGYFAHRVSYEMHKGEIPSGAIVCHSCDTPICVNPDHLFCGTQRDNISDAIAKGRHTSQKPAAERRRLTSAARKARAKRMVAA